MSAGGTERDGANGASRPRERGRDARGSAAHAAARRHRRHDQVLNGRSAGPSLAEARRGAAARPADAEEAARRRRVAGGTVRRHHHQPRSGLQRQVLGRLERDLCVLSLDRARSRRG